MTKEQLSQTPINFQVLRKVMFETPQKEGTTKNPDSKDLQNFILKNNFPPKNPSKWKFFESHPTPRASKDRSWRIFNSETRDKSRGQQKECLEANQRLDCTESEKLGSSDP